MYPNLNTLKISFLTTISLLLLNGFSLMAQVDYKEDLAVTEYDVGYLLTWTTSSETNNQFFVIERAQDGGPFETIGSVNSKPDASNTAYKYVDLDLGLKKVKYRLKQVSTGGEYSYSDEIQKEKEFVSYFRVASKEKITDELFQVTVTSIKNGEMEYRLTNDLGDVLIEELKPLQVGLNDYVIDFQSEADGNYHLIFKLGPELESVFFKKETKDKKGNVATKEEEGAEGGG